MTVAPTTPTPPPGSGGPGSTIQLTIAVDAKTGLLTIQNVTAGLKGVGTAATSAGAAANTAGAAAHNSSGGWLSLYAQTELVARGLHGVASTMNAMFVQSTLVAARTEVLNTTLSVTAKNMNYATGAALAQVEGIRKMNIAHQDAIQSTLQLMRAQVDLTKATGLARAAQDLAVIAGENSSETLEHITEAIQEQNVWMLRQYGIVTYLDTALEQYASKLNKSAAALTQQERSQAILNLVMTEAAKVSGAYTQSMEDAGKKALSLQRVSMDMHEHIGNEFLPIMNKLVDVLTTLGEWLTSAPGWVIRVGGAFTTAAATVAILTIAAMALGRAWMFVAGAAESAAVAEGAAAGAGFIKTLTSLAAANPYIAALIVGLTAVAGIYVALNKSLDASLKSQEEAQNSVLTQVSQVQNLKKEWEEIETEQTRLADIAAGQAGFNDRELATHSLLGAREAARLVQLESESALQGRVGLALKLGKDLQGDIVQLQRDLNTGLTTEVLNREKLVALEKALVAEKAGSLKAAQDIAAQAHEDLRAKQAEQLRLQEMVSKGQTIKVPGYMSLQEYSPVPALQATEKEVAHLGEIVKKADADVLKFTSDATGIQKVPQMLTAALTTLTTVQGMYQSMVTAQRMGLKISEDQKTLMADQVAGALNWNKAIRDQVTYNEQVYATQVKEKTISQEAFDLYKKEDSKLLEIADQAAQNHKTSLTGIQAQNSAALGGLAEFITRAGKAYLSITKDATTGIMPLLQQMQAAQIAFAQMDQQYAGERRGVQVQLKNAMQEELRSGVQLYDTRAKQVTVEREIADLGRADTLLQAALSGASAETLSILNKVLEITAKIAEQTQLEAIARERTRGLQDLEKSAIQAQVEAYGAVEKTQEKLLTTDRDRALEDARLLNTGLALAEAEKSILDRYYAQLFVLRQETAEKRAQLQVDTLQMQQQAVESRRGTEGYQRSQVDALVALDKQRTDKEIENFRTSAEYQKMWNADTSKDHIKSEEYFWAFSNSEAAKHYAYVHSLEEDFRRSQIEKETELFKVQLQSGGKTPEAVSRLMAQRDLYNQIEETAKKLKLTEEERVKLHQVLGDQLKRQQEIQKEQEKISKGRSVEDMDLGATGNAEALKNLQGAAGGAAENLKQVREEYEEGKASLQELIDATKAYQDSLQSLNDILTLVMNGMKPDKFSVMTVGFKMMGDAALVAFEALGKGQSVGAALKNFGSAILKELSGFAMKQAIFHLMAGIADSSNQYTAAEAPGEYKAAAMWGAAAAALGIIAGATSGGGGGGAASGSRGTAVGTPAPVSTKTAMEDNIIKLNDNLVVNNRVMQYAGQAYDKTGAQMFQMIHDINMLGVSRSAGDKAFADQLADQLARRTQAGFQPGQMQQWFNNMNNYLATNNQHSIKYAGILTSINTNLLESSQQHNSQARSLPTLLADRLAENLRGAQKVQNESGQVMIGLARQQLTELQKANEKNMVVSVDASTVLDAGALNTLTTSGFLKNTATYNRAVAGAVTTATQQNVNRQAMGRALGNGGI